MSKRAAMRILNTAKKTDAKGFRLEDVLFTGIIRTKADMPVPHYEKVNLKQKNISKSICLMAARIGQ